MCYADALITMVKDAPPANALSQYPDPTVPVYNFITLLAQLESLYVESNGVVANVCVQFPEDDQVYHVFLGPTKEPSEYSSTCASWYVRDRYDKKWTNFTTWFNVQVRDEEEEEVFVGTMFAAFKRCQKHRFVRFVATSDNM
ncbi:hypothetical protein GGF32_009615 [Allomyces javanicus]|nr:hypothetical protein GGF32_009615 [Allomyces javanicus]